MTYDVFPSLSEFFESVLVVLTNTRRLSWLYIEQEEAKGFMHDEIYCLLKAEITFRRLDN